MKNDYKIRSIKFLKKHQPMPCDEDTKLTTITTLAQLALDNIKVIDVIDVIKKEISIITDEDIIEFAEELLDDIQNSVEIV